MEDATKKKGKDDSAGVEKEPEQGSSSKQQETENAAQDQEAESAAAEGGEDPNQDDGQDWQKAQHS